MREVLALAVVAKAAKISSMVDSCNNAQICHRGKLANGTFCWQEEAAGGVNNTEAACCVCARQGLPSSLCVRECVCVCVQEASFRPLRGEC